MTTPRLAAAMIVRDEERYLAGCLRSIRDVVDEVVVVDTGSTDASQTIANDHGARLFCFEWNGDFSAARNEALRHARADWILYVDADERGGPLRRSELDAVLSQPSVVAATVRFRPQTGYTRYREPRLFRNDPRIRFHGVIHETMVPAIQEICTREGRVIAESPLTLDHLGYDDDQRRKHPRNLPLLRARLASEPDHTYSWNHLARTLAALGDEGAARQAWRRAIETTRGRTDGPIDCLPYADLLRREPLERDHDALLREALERFPGNYSLAWIQGRRLMAVGAFAKAIPIFERLIAVDAETLCEGSMAHDMRIFGVLAHDSLACCCFRTARYDDSARHYRLAGRCAPDDARYAVKARLAEARACRTT